MQIDNLAIAMHPRSSWKAFDLGCKMALRWYKPLIGFWLTATLPFFILLNFVDLVYGMLLLWLFKPWFERGLLYILSRQVFGQQVSALEALKAWPSQIKPLWFSSVTWRRLSPSRGFDLAVAQLEGLIGKARSDRLTVLHRTSDDNSGWWLIICLHWEMFLLMGMIAIVVALIPEGIDFELFAVFVSDDWRVGLGYNILTYISWALIAPFFIAGSFAAYLNRRTLLEGWDIELQFKKMRQQHASRLLSLFCVALLCGGLAGSPQSIAQQTEQAEVNTQVSVTASTTESELAQEEPEFESKRMLNEILDEPPFYQSKTETDWRWVGFTLPESEDEPSSLPAWFIAFVSFIAMSIEIILWGTFIVIVCLILYLSRHRIAALFSPSEVPVQTETSFVPSFTQAYEAEELPEDVLSEVEQLLAQQAYRKLMSLLLITSLMDISRYQSLPLTKSMTEKECLKEIKRAVKGEKSAFMSDLIDTWINLAWAHKIPFHGHMTALCEQYRTLFHAEEQVS